MRGGLRLSGSEVWTVELRGTIPAAVVTGSGPPVDFLVRDDAVEVGLLVFEMRGLALRGVPGPRFSYREALWRLAVDVDGKAGWLGHTCDLDRPVMRFLGRRMIRYPARTATIELAQTEDGWDMEVCAAATLRVTLQLTDETPPPVAPRPVLVVDDGRGYAVPWDEDPAPFRRLARVAAMDDGLSASTLGGEVRWEDTGLVHRGRTHHCGFARRRAAHTL